jgi:glutathione S-transferase
MPEITLDPNFRTLVQVDVVLVIWLMTMGNYTSLLRLRRKVYATPEDYKFNHVIPIAPADDDVERSRRMHLNHLENVLPFLVLSVLYAATRPSHATFEWLMWGFLAARILYTVFYARAMQPHRTIAFTIGAVLMFVMALLTLRSTF